jgi:hypothetical protein
MEGGPIFGGRNLTPKSCTGFDPKAALGVPKMFGFGSRFLTPESDCRSYK